MGGTIKGGKKAAAKNLARNPNFYKELGRAGGSVKNPKKGFGGNRQLASTAGRRGGRLSSRPLKLIGLDGDIATYRHKTTGEIVERKVNLEATS